MFYLNAGVNLAVLNVGVNATHVSKREMNNDAAASVTTEASGRAMDDFFDGQRSYRGPLESLLDQPSFRHFDAAPPADPQG
jgi:hypothetical protein